MPTDAAAADQKYREAPHRFPAYYGFDPDQEYIIRSRVMTYSYDPQKNIGLGHGRYRFAGGEAIVPRMRPNATEDQRWDRGERLKWYEQNFETYRVYARAAAPPRDLEPLWAGQEIPAEDRILEESGEERYPDAELDSGSPAYLASYPKFDDGEAEPEPKVTTTRGRALKGSPELEPGTED